jgi:hypothetical protein
MVHVAMINTKKRRKENRCQGQKVWLK